MVERCLKRTCSELLLCLATAVILAAVPVGCGKKGPPRLPNIKTPSEVTNLALAAEGAELVLTWTAPKVSEDEGASRPAGYLVYRSAEPVGEETCEGCPVLFQRVEKIPLTESDGTGQALVYREALLPGTRYRFKVVSYDVRGQLGPDSNIVKIVTD